MPVDRTRESWKPGMSWEKAVEDIEYIRGLGREMGGPERVERQHLGGRYTVRERIEKMVDARIQQSMPDVTGPVYGTDTKN